MVTAAAQSELALCIVDGKSSLQDYSVKPMQEQHPGGHSTWIAERLCIYTEPLGLLSRCQPAPGLGGACTRRSLEHGGVGKGWYLVGEAEMKGEFVLVLTAVIM